MSKRSIAGLIGGAVMLSGAFASSALAHHNDEEIAKTTIAMDYKPAKGKFVGQVSSVRAKCLGGRTVRLFKNSTDAVVGTVRTNDDGGFSFARKKNSGKYYAKVSAETYVIASELDKYGELLWEHTLTCTGGKSDVEGSF